MYGGLFCGGEICSEFVDACSEGVCRDYGCKCEICDVFRAKRFYILPALAHYVFLHEEVDIWPEQKQYHQHIVDCTFEQCNDWGILGGDVHAEAAEDTEAVIGVFVQRHCVKCRHTDIYSRKVVEEDEYGGCVVVPFRNEISVVCSHFISNSISYIASRVG